MSNAIALCAALPLPAVDGGRPAAPEMIHLVPAGDIRTVDGRGPYRLTDAAKVAAAFKAGDRLPIDENHATDLAAPKGGASPARGWITGLEARDDGLWGRVDWTGEGRRLVEDRAYRHISPAILHSKTGEVAGVVRASLVNLPNMMGLVALHSQQELRLDLAKLRAGLGLKDDADEAAVTTAIDALKTTVSTHAAVLKAAGLAENATEQVALQGVQALTARASGFAPVLKELGLAETAEPALALQAVQALKDPTKVVPAAELVALQSQFKTLSDETSRERATAFVDKAIEAQKVGVKAMRDHYISRHMTDRANVEKEIGALPSLHGAGVQTVRQPGAAAGGVELTADEARIVSLMGIDPKSYREARDARDAMQEAL